MKEKYRMEAITPMFHLAERNLLLKVFEERTQGIFSAPGEVKMLISKRLNEAKIFTPVFETVMENAEEMQELPMQLMRDEQLRLHDGWLALEIKVSGVSDLKDAEQQRAVELIVNAAKVLELFASGDVFMKVAVAELVARIMDETGANNLTDWVMAYLDKPPYMERPEVRRYYRLHKNHLNHAKPQNLLERTAEMLVEKPV